MIRHWLYKNRIVNSLHRKTVGKTNSLKFKFVAFTEILECYWAALQLSSICRLLQDWWVWDPFWTWHRSYKINSYSTFLQCELGVDFPRAFFSYNNSLLITWLLTYNSSAFVLEYDISNPMLLYSELIYT